MPTLDPLPDPDPDHPAWHAAVDGVARHFAARFPRYAGDLRGAAWERALAEVARAPYPAVTAPYAARAATWGCLDYLRRERRLGRAVVVEHDEASAEALRGACAPAALDRLELRDAFARLPDDDAAVLARGAVYGAAPARPHPGDPAPSRSAQAWRRHASAQARARALWGAS